MIKFIKELLFGRRAKPVCTIITTMRTVQPTTHPTDFGDWCKEFNISMLYDRKPLHLN